MERKLYQWQEECLERWLANGGRGMVQAVTGSGKTLLALHAAGKLEKALGRRLYVKIVVPTGALMQQWYKALREYLPDSREEDGEPGESGHLRRKIGLRGSGRKDPPGRRYMIYVINSARYELARQILSQLRDGLAVLLIADECHRYESGQNRLIFEFLPYMGQYGADFYSLGLSATLPGGQAQRYLASVLGRRIYSYGMAEALAAQTVCPYDIFHISLEFSWGEREEYEELTDQMTYLYRKILQSQPNLRSMKQREFYEALRSLAGDRDRGLAEAASKYMMLSYKRKNLVCLASARCACACDLVDRLDSGEKMIIFGERIRQAEELYRLLEAHYPGRVGRCHSKMGGQANKNVVERFREGEIRILIACKSIDEGVDIPDASVGIILSGTSVQRQRIQRLGRVIRKKEEKSRASLYYLHIAETSEDACFLPDGGGNRIFELEYMWEIRDFYHPDYDEAAVKLYGRIRDAGADAERLEEVRRCLRLGCVRADWTRECDNMEEQIRRAGSVRDRNYWICMKKLAAESGDKPQ